MIVRIRIDDLEGQRVERDLLAIKAGAPVLPRLAGIVAALNTASTTEQGRVSLEGLSTSSST
jgi:hypothetical protein